MFWILAFLASAGAYVFAHMRVVAVALLVGPLILAVLWFSDQTHINALMVDSWQFLSGVQTPGAVVADCPDGSKQADNLGIWAIVPMLGGLALSIFNLAVGIGAIVMVPAGLVRGVVAATRSLWSRRAQGLEGAARWLAIGLGLVVLSGLIMRAVHAISQIGC